MGSKCVRLGSGKIKSKEGTGFENANKFCDLTINLNQNLTEKGENKNVRKNY